MAKKIVTFMLNERETDVIARPLQTLQDLLRTELDFTATKSGCKQGGCGSCTVLVDGEPMLSCLLPVEDVAGKAVTTLEGLTPSDGLHPVQEAFFEEYGTQCGYCTPGMIIVSTALLKHNPAPTREQIVDALAGNYCRCTGYDPIINAVSAAVHKMNGSGE